MDKDNKKETKNLKIVKWLQKHAEKKTKGEGLGRIMNLAA